LGHGLQQQFGALSFTFPVHILIGIFGLLSILDCV
jgi:hypothetical protein